MRPRNSASKWSKRCLPGTWQDLEEPSFKEERKSGSILKSTIATSSSVSVHEGTMVMSLMQSLLSVENVAIVVLTQALVCEVSPGGMPLTRTTKGFLDAAVVGTFDT